MNLPQKQIVQEIFDEVVMNNPNIADKPPAATYPASLANVDLSRKAVAQLGLDPIVMGVLFGTLFADCSFAINKGYKNARFQSRHSTRQASWFYWKYMIVLADYFNGISSVTFQKSDGFQAKSAKKPTEKYLGKFKIASKAMPILTQIYNIVCGGGSKKFERSWLNHMNSYFLLTLWLDDGSLYNKRQGSISLEAFGEAQMLVVINYLKTVWGIESSIQDLGYAMADGRPAKRVHIDDQESLLKLLRIVAPLVPVREMLYKCYFVSNGDVALTQRWAAELKQLVKPEFKGDVEAYYQKISLLAPRGGR